MNKSLSQRPAISSRLWLGVLVATAASGCSAPQSSRVLVTINAGSDIARPTELSISWLSARGTLYRRDHLQPDGSLPADGPLITIAVDMKSSDASDRKLLVHGTTSMGQPSIGALRIPFGTEDPMELAMHASLADSDQDGLPDVIDDCPNDNTPNCNATRSDADPPGGDAGAPGPDTSPDRSSVDAQGPSKTDRMEASVAPRDASPETSAPAFTRDGLVAAWLMEEGAGMVVSDVSGNANDGLLRKPTGADWADGQHGRALALAGASWVVTATSMSFDTLDTDISLAAWVWWAGGNGGTQAIVARQRGTDTTNWFWLGVHGDTVRFAVQAISVDAPAPLPTSRWTHVAATFDGAQLVIYIDGVEVGRRMSPPKLGTGIRGLTIGADSDSVDINTGTSFFRGRLDDVLVYNRPLSVAEIGQLATP